MKKKASKIAIGIETETVERLKDLQAILRDKKQLKLSLQALTNMVVSRGIALVQKQEEL